LLLLALVGGAAVAFARPRGFGVATPAKETIIDVSPTKEVSRTSALTAPPAPGKPGPSGADVVIAGGSLAGLWLALLLSAGAAAGRVARIRVFEGSWKSTSSGQLQIKENRTDAEASLDVATIEGHVWDKMPDGVAEAIKEEGGYVEQWPRRPLDAGLEAESQAFPRNVAVRSLEKCLLDAAQKAEKVELIPQDYSATEHRELLSAGDPFQCLVFANDGPALKACEDIFDDLFALPVPRDDRSGFIVAAEKTLAVSFDLESPKLSVGASMALSWAQRRYFLTWAGGTRGLLHMRLTPDEGQAITLLQRTASPADLLSSLNSPAEGSQEAQQLWQDLREGCKYYGIPEDSLTGAACFSADVADRPSYTQFLSEDSGPLAAFLIGRAARGHAAEIGPGFGAGAALEEATSLAKALLSDRAARSPRFVDVDAISTHELIMKRLQSTVRQPGLGLGECIASGLKRGVAEADDCILKRVEASLEQFARSSDLPPAVRETLPDAAELKGHIVGAGLQDRTFSAMAAAGPRPDAAQEKDAKTSAQAEAAAFDFGGETPEGLAAAAALEQQAKAGSAESQFQLGVMYVTANGVAKDMGKALKWLLAAAKQDHLEAMNCAATMLRNGLGCEIRKEEAARWFEKAGNKGHAEAQFNLGEMLCDAEIAPDQERGVLLFEKAAAADLDFAQYRLGYALRQGSGTEIDVPRGMQYIEKAAKQGLPQAQYMMGSCLFCGDGVQRNEEQAAERFRQAAEQGHGMAQYSLGVMYELGEGVPQSDSQAQHWFRLAAAQGLLEARARVRGQGLLAPPQTR